MTQILNIAAYRFVHLSMDDLPTLRGRLKDKANQYQLKGTILLSEEGINLFLAGLADNVEKFQAVLNGITSFKDLTYKNSWSKEQPFTRMLVRLKKEIISMGCEEVQPEKHTAPYISPEDFKEWYDKNKDMVVLDTRNDYEMRLGTFKNAVDLNLDHFRQFPQAIKQLSKEAKNKPVVTFCTGGIRCEKAAELLLSEGFNEVYQLDGGILNYFEQCGGDHYDGDCFVFDKRVAVDAQLKETEALLCFSCREPLAITDCTDDYVCKYCQQDRRGRREAAG